MSGVLLDYCQLIIREQEQWCHGSCIKLLATAELYEEAQTCLGRRHG